MSTTIERPAWVQERLNNGDLPTTQRLTYADKHGQTVIDRHLFVDCRYRIPVFVAPDFFGDVAAQVMDVVHGCPEVLLKKLKGIIIPGVNQPDNPHIAGTCTRTNMVTFWGEPNGEGLFDLVSPLVIDHELAHCMKPDGGPHERESWKAAQLADMKVIPSRLHRIGPKDMARPLSYGGLNRSIYSKSQWISCYAQDTQSISEDWAESVMLWMAEQRGANVFGKRRFRDWYPNRDRLIRQWLKSPVTQTTEPSPWNDIPVVMPVWESY